MHCTCKQQYAKRLLTKNTGEKIQEKFREKDRPCQGRIRLSSQSYMDQADPTSTQSEGRTRGE